MRVFYSWWIVLVAFFNLFFVVGIPFYGFPVFYPEMIHSLGFSHAQLTLGFLVGFTAAGLPFGILAGVLIDRVGAGRLIRVGIWSVSLSLMLMGHMTRLWHYNVLCITLVVGYVLSGPVPNQVLISQWFELQRGRAMGIAYLGLGLGGVILPLFSSWLIQTFGWRHAMEILGALTLVTLFPLAQWITRSSPSEIDLFPDGRPPSAKLPERLPTACISSSAGTGDAGEEFGHAVRSANFWLLLAGCTLTIGAIGAVTQHLVLFLQDQGHSLTAAARISSVLLTASLAGRVIVGCLAERYTKKNVMALFYFLVGLAIPLLFLVHRPVAVWAFALTFGFALGADYMLVPLVAAECFGLRALGKLLSLIIAGYSLGQWLAPWVAGRLFDSYRHYDLAWGLMTLAALLGAATIYAIAPAREP